MKINWLIILVFFILLSAFNLRNSFDFKSPSIKIETKDAVYKAGDVVFFTINICATEYIDSFKITPEVIGKNKDSEVIYNFDFNTKTVTISYFYVIPEITQISSINIIFLVNDKSNDNLVVKKILLKQ